MIERRHFGLAALSLAAILGVVMAIVTDGALLPLMGPGALVYWLLALGSAGFAIGGLIAGQRLMPLLALIVVAATLVPTAQFAYQCSLGNCL